MKILVTGSHGLVGAALLQALKAGGHEAIQIVRTGGDGIRWNPPHEGPDSHSMAGGEAVVHLAGENIGARRWSAAQKKRLRESRVNATRALCQSLAAMKPLPKVLLSASAVGIYGSCREVLLSEDSPPGDDFLAKLARDWEEATGAASEPGIRVVHLRLGIVLSPKGGALAKMLTPFKMCLGGCVGSGRQWWSWVTLADTARAILFALENETLSGPVNVVAGSDTNRDFAQALGQALGRPAIFPLPAFVARLALGEMADALLLASTRVESRELRKRGFEFNHEALAPALRELLGA